MSVRHPQSRVVGRRIAAARQAAVLSQQEFADRLKALEPGQEWSRETVVNLELGRRAITIERLLAMATVLHTPRQPSSSTTLRSPPSSRVWATSPHSSDT
jgi:transcriptional regulator with XRE-family HTH domain